MQCPLLLHSYFFLVILLYNHIAIWLYLVGMILCCSLSKQSIGLSKTSRLPLMRWRCTAPRPGDQASLRPLTVSALPGHGWDSLSL